MKNYYAMFDHTVTKNNPGYGFANTKSGIAFSTKARRDAFVASRDFDNTTRAVTRKDLFRLGLVERVYGGEQIGVLFETTDYSENKICFFN